MTSAPKPTPTPSARAEHVLTLAEGNARARSGSTVVAEDLLAAILTEGRGVAVNVLTRLGADPATLARTLGSHRPTDAGTPLVELLTSAANEAEHLGHSYIGTEHLLIAVARATSSEASRSLAAAGVTADAAAATTAALLGREIGR